MKVPSGKRGGGVRSPGRVALQECCLAQRFHGWELQKAFMAKGGEAP